MTINKSVGVKLTIEITTQEMFDNAMKELNGADSELVDNITFSLVTGYEKNIKQLFQEGLLYVVFGADFRETLNGIDMLEINIMTNNDKLIKVNHSDIKNILDLAHTV